MSFYNWFYILFEDILNPMMPMRDLNTMDVRQKKEEVMLFVNGLGDDMKDDELLQLFIRYKAVRARIECNGFGIVYFGQMEEARKARKEMNGYRVGRGCRMGIEWVTKEC